MAAVRVSNPVTVNFRLRRCSLAKFNKIPQPVKPPSSLPRPLRGVSWPTDL